MSKNTAIKISAEEFDRRSENATILRNSAVNSCFACGVCGFRTVPEPEKSVRDIIRN